MMAKIKVAWKDLSFSIDTPQGRKTILSDFTGQLESSQLVAVLGPSGSGKTTFLKCLAGRCKPTGGSIQFYSQTSERNWAYVPQKCEMYAYLTVEEYLRCASRFKNCFESKKQHDEAVQNMKKVFLLEKCAKTLVKNCSGGELKRLAVALEMISNPETLFLDEPTTGLDSAMGTSCVRFFNAVVRGRGAEASSSILMTIHQPNSELFKLFDYVYILSQGVSIYAGAPEGLLGHFEKANLWCEPNSNPADFAVNIASRGTYDPTVRQLHKLYVAQLKDGNRTQIHEQSSFIPNETAPFFTCLCVHVKRFVLTDGRDPLKFLMHVIFVTFFPLFSALFAASNMFQSSICIYNALNETHVEQESPYERFDRRDVSLDGSRILMYNVMFNFIAYAGLGMMSFSSHFNCLKAEQMNKWYSCSSFFVAYLLVAAMNGILYTSLNCIAILAVSHGIFTIEIFFYFWATSVLVCWYGECLGLLFGAVFPTNILVCFGALSAVDSLNILLADIVILTEFMVPSLRLLSQLSGLGQLMDVLLTVVYPTELCQVDDVKLFTFHQVVDFVRFYNFRTNSTLDDFEDIRVNTWEGMSSKLWTKSDIIQLLSSHNNMTAMAVDQLGLFWNTDLNIVINEHGLGEANVWRSVLIAVSLSVAYCLLSWCIISCKMKSARPFTGEPAVLKSQVKVSDDQIWHTRL